MNINFVVHLAFLLIQWLKGDFLTYLSDWENELSAIPNLPSKERQRMCISRETLQGLRITGDLLLEAT